LLDVAGATKVSRLVRPIVEKLESSGSSAFTALLDHPDARVRASAGAFLLRSMPDRVVPILREIEEKGAWQQCPFHCVQRHPLLAARGQARKRLGISDAAKRFWMDFTSFDPGYVARNYTPSSALRRSPT
jgi:hypothetical protein